MKRPALLAAVVAALLGASCAGVAPTQPPIALPPTPTPPPAATLATASAPAPTATLTPTPSPASTAPPDTLPPISPVDLLLSYAHADLRATCVATDQIYDTELASISCGTDDLPFDYSLFASVNDLRAEFRADVDGADTPPQPDGTCAQGNYEAIYERDDGPVGRINCREHTSSSGGLFHVLEWTHEPLLVIGYISNNVAVHSWDELIQFWEEQAGPFQPT